MAVFEPEIRSGDLRHRVAIQKATESDDAYGQQGHVWNTQVTVWAKVTPLGGRELVIAQQMQAQTSHAVEMRYNPDLAVVPTFRLLYGTRVLNLLAVLDVGERHIKTVALCVELKTP